ncbi:MAG TPA: hypothetical protein VF627_14355 [Abditibacterium sp.]|jgi:hypothetical protein
MKFRSTLAAVVPCVLLTTLLVRAQDQKTPDTFLLKLQLSKTFTQEIAVTANDEFHISTADSTSKWLVEGKTEIVQEPGQEKVMTINLVCRNQPTDTKQSPSMNRLMTRVAVPLKSKIVLAGLLSTDNPEFQGRFTAKAPAKFVEEAEPAFRISIENRQPQNPNWLDDVDAEINRSHPNANPYK